MDQAITKLKEVLRLTDALGRRVGSIGTSGNVNVSSGGSNTTNIVNGGSSVAAAGAGLGGSIAGGAVGASIVSSFAPTKGVLGAITHAGKKVAAAMHNYTVALGRASLVADDLAKATNTGKYGPRFSHDPNSPIGGGPHFNPKIGDWFPPKIPKDQTTSPYLPGANSPWKPNKGFLGMFKETLNTKKWEETFGGGMSVTGGLGKVAAGLVSKFTPLVVASAALYGAFKLLKEVIHLIAEGIKTGFEAFKNAARTGGSVSSNTQMDFAFKALGIEGLDAAQLQAQFNRKSTQYKAPGTDEILGAAKTGQFGNAQQLSNLAEEFKAAMNDAAVNAKQIAESSKANFQVSVRMSELGREWKTLWTQIAAIVSPLLKEILDYLKLFLHMLNAKYEMYVWLGQKTGFISKGDKTFGNINGPGVAPSFTSWEKIGLHFGQGKNTAEKAIQETAKNTKDTTFQLTKIAGMLLYQTMAPVMGLPNIP